MLRLHVTGPLQDGMALFHVITSYDGAFMVTVFACRQALPDVGFCAECLDASLADMVAATEDSAPPVKR